MPEKPEYCTYSTVKLDDQLMYDAKAVASLNRKSVQDWVSDLVNEAIAKSLNKKPIKRRPPKPRGRKPS